MNRAQGFSLLIGAVGAAVILLFPGWCTRNGDLKIDRGRAWILSPPSRMGPEDFRLSDVRGGLSEQDRQVLRDHLAAAYGEPEIDWAVQVLLLAGVLSMAGAAAFACRGPRRPTSDDQRIRALADRAFRVL